jgi:hypothetical protein
MRLIIDQKQIHGHHSASNQVTSIEILTYPTLSRLSRLIGYFKYPSIQYIEDPADTRSDLTVSIRFKSRLKV